MREALRLWLPLALLLVIVAVLGWELLGGYFTGPKVKMLPDAPVPRQSAKANPGTAPPAAASPQQQAAEGKPRGIQKCVVNGQVTYSEFACPKEAQKATEITVNPQHNVMEGPGRKAASAAR
jgi:hypothetical protein